MPAQDVGCQHPRRAQPSSGAVGGARPESRPQGADASSWARLRRGHGHPGRGHRRLGDGGRPVAGRGLRGRPRPDDRRHDPRHRRAGRARPGGRGPARGAARGPPARGPAHERQPVARGGRPGRRRGDATRHRLPQRPRLPARPTRRPGADRLRGPRRRLREGRHGDPADEDRRGVHGLGGAPRPGAARRRRDLGPARRDHPRHRRRRRVHAGRADAARRQADRRDHAVQARPAPVRRRGPAPPDHPRRPGGHRVQRRREPRRRRDGSPPSCASSWT